MTQLAPAGALPPAFLGFVGSVQPELANSYNHAALQGQLRGHPCAWLVAPSAWLLGHLADPELGAKGFMPLWPGTSTARTLPLFPPHSYLWLFQDVCWEAQ